MIREIIKHRRLIWNLAINDFKSKYANSFLGTVWAVVLPLVNILVFWYVFQVGLKNNDVNGFPFIVWYVPSFLSWTYFSEAFSGASNSIREYSYLVKKVNFPIMSIPIVKVISSLIIHVIFLFVIMFINCCYGIYPSIYYLQIVYYVFGITIYLIGLGWLFGALSVVIPDTINVVNIIMQLGFWVTPIIWNPDNMQASTQFILKINPLFYICQGYRNTFIYNKWFWEDGGLTFYFWTVTIIIWLVGSYVYDRTKDRFADLL